MANAPLRVGFVGIGNMGLAMAGRLLELGFSVAVHDIAPHRMADARALGAQGRATPAALAAAVDALIVAVVDAAQTEDVLFGAHGAAAALAAGSTVLLCPTIGPADTERLAARLAASGIGCVDAPMSGGPARARSGTMSLMVAAEDVVFDRCRPVLDALSSCVFRVGTQPGDGARTKLVNNLLAAVNLAGAAEALALAARVGLDPQRTLAVLQASSGQSWVGEDRLRRALAGDRTPRAHMALLAKDSSLALDMAQEAGFVATMGGVAGAVFAAALAEGLGSEDDSALYARSLSARLV